MTSKKRVMNLDLETYSGADLSKTGVHRYVEDPDFEILLIGYSIDGGPAEVHDCTTPGCWPRELLDALTDPNIIKSAYNAQFERTCLCAALEEEMPPEQWEDTMIRGLECGLPASLAAAGAAMGLPEDKLKDPVGKALIQYFCKPCRPTKANGGRTRNLPQHDPARWKQFIEYNRRDVVTEMAIREKLLKYEPHPNEWALWRMDQRMNDNGVRLDVPMIEKIVRYDERNRKKLQEAPGGGDGHHRPEQSEQPGTAEAMAGITGRTCGAAPEGRRRQDAHREPADGCPPGPGDPEGPGQDQRREIQRHGGSRLQRRPPPRHPPVLWSQSLRKVEREAGADPQPGTEQPARP